MHEHTFIQAIIKDIPNKENVIRVDIELGELVGIGLDHLKEHLVEETSWEVNIKNVSSKIKCSACGYEGQAKIKERLHDLVIFCCPKCKDFNVDVLEGQDIKIKNVVYE